MNIILIPARGGSKRIPRKNIKEIKGRPIIEWVISEAKKLDDFEMVVVSTDDKEIANIALDAGAEIPFIRPDNLSGDYASTRDVVLHTINFFKDKGIEIDTICCIYPTALFISEKDISESFRKLKNESIETYIFSATKFPHPIKRSFSIDKKGFSKMIFPDNFSSRTQDLETAYHDAGQFYIASKNTWLKKSNLLERSIPYILPRMRAIDIDTIEDWEYAEFIFGKTCITKVK